MILRSLAVGSRERILVVCVGAKQLVVGVAPSGFSFLCELDEPLPLAQPTNVNFAVAIRKALERWHGG
jgi:flagellar protein FliO/FliZ